MAVLVGSLLALAAPAHGFVYWTNMSSGLGVGRADLDATNVETNLIDGASGPCGVALDGTHVYWANGGQGWAMAGGNIGRVNLDGTGAVQNLVTGGSGVCGVAVDGSHIYWANHANGAGTTIGRANLDAAAPRRRSSPGRRRRAA